MPRISVFALTKFFATKPSTPQRQLLRVIGTTDIEGKGNKHSLADVDPFILLDEARLNGDVPETFAKHPHMGLMAISYLLKGEIRAWDNLNGELDELNRAGGVYVVDSGKGIVHGEAITKGRREAKWLQLWVNPGVHKTPLAQANYQLFQPHELPTLQQPGFWAKIIIGEYCGLKSPVSINHPLCYMHLKIDANNQHVIAFDNPGWRGFIYVLNGNAEIGEEKVLASEQQCLILERNNKHIRIENNTGEPFECIIARGEAHNRPFFKLLGHGGALVASSEYEVSKAMKKYQKELTNFGK